MFNEVIGYLTSGFIKTLEIFVATLLGALPLGLLISLCLISKNKVIRRIFSTIVWIIRGTPLMLQLLIIFYGPSLFFGINVWSGDDKGRLFATITAFIINYSCYISEIYRGGIESVDIGQKEAGQVLGLSKSQIFFHITLKQVVKRILPPLSNEVISLVKDTSLARTISVCELIWAGQSFIKSSGLIWPLFLTGVYYLVFCGLITILFDKLEKKLSYFD